MVLFEKLLYPGIIQCIENDVMVKCMHIIGPRSFYWPSPRDDVSWYSDNEIVAIIFEPTLANRRHYCINTAIWESLQALYK